MIVVTASVWHDLWRGYPLREHRGRQPKGIPKPVGRPKRIREEFIGPPKPRWFRVPKPIDPRVAVMKEMYCTQGKTLDEVGSEFGVTRERIRQLLVKEGISGIDGGRTIKRRFPL